MLFWVILTPIWVALVAILIFRFTKNSTLASSLPQNTEKESVSKKETAFVFAAALLFRVGILFLVLFLVRFLSSQDSALPTLTEIFSAWDGTHYVNLVEKGYSGYREAGRPIFLVFFPLYVWVVRFFRLFIPNTMAAGLLVSFLSYAGGCCFVYRMVNKLYNRTVALRSILYLSIFPFSFFFGGMMTEGLFLLTTAASLYYTAEHKWWRAGLWGALAAMSRMTGMLTAIAILVEYIEYTKPFRQNIDNNWMKRWIIKLPAAGIPFLGTILYLVLNYAVTRNCFSFLEYQGHWAQGGQWLPNTIRLLVRNAGEYKNESHGVSIWIPELILFVVFLLLLILAIMQKKHKSFISIYGLAYLTVSYSLSWLLSAGRYLSSSIVFFIFAAVLTERWKWLDKVITVVFSILFGIYLFAFVAGAEIM
ncbi:glycosyltransferase family 39 protein [Scatolibacter rhodanostii]|uniref:glycosyltransferase family 39 protein n=1 Tax=Scatolibacter rhodanostii TaxID=2014781 RepID=UPI000C07AFE4|nr:glycosyltransferase family 39 protein [Scatolibacter rhodanostii]